jgi:MFS family permease
MKETAELPEDAAAAPPRKHLPTPLFGLLIVPFGIVLGYVQVTLPYVFSVQLQGDPDATTKIAAFQAIALQPHSFKFIIEPALDARWRKKSWFLVAVAVTTIFFVVSMFFQRSAQSHLTLLAALLFVANAAVATSSGAMHALMAITLPKEKKGSAAGWAMAGNLGGTGLGGALGIILTDKVPLGVAAVIMGALVVLATLPAFFITEPAAESHPIFRAIGRLLRDAWRTLKSRDGWTGLVICLSPIGAGGLTGLFSDIAGRYQAGPNQVALVNGLFGGIVSAIGCVLGGYVADKMNRRLAYALAGAITGAIAIAMSFMPLTPNVYTVGCLAYQFALGIAYAAWAAFVLDLMGHDAGVATKHAILTAAANQATNYMLVFDGLAADRHVFGGWLGEGPKAALRADALGTVAGLALLGVILMVIRRFRAERSPTAT